MLVLKSQKKPFFVKKQLHNKQLQILDQQQQQLTQYETSTYDENSMAFNESDFKSLSKIQPLDKLKYISVAESSVTHQNSSQNCQQNQNIEIQRKRNPQKLLQPLQTVEGGRSIERKSQNISIGANSTKHEQFIQQIYHKKSRGGQKLQKLHEINFNENQLTPWESKNTVDLLDVCQDNDFGLGSIGDIGSNRGIAGNGGVQQGIDRYLALKQKTNNQFNLKNLKLISIDEEDKVIGGDERYLSFLQNNQNRCYNFNDSQDSIGKSASVESNLLTFSNQLKSVATYKKIKHNTSQEINDNQSHSSSQHHNQTINPLQSTRGRTNNNNNNSNNPLFLSFTNMHTNTKGRCQSLIKQTKEANNPTLLSNNSYNYQQQDLNIHTENIIGNNPYLTNIFATNETEYDAEGFLNGQNPSERVHTFDETQNRKKQIKKNHLKAICIISQIGSEQGGCIKDSVSSFQTLKQLSLGRQATPGGNNSNMQNLRTISRQRNISISGDASHFLRPIQTPQGMSSIRGEKGLQDRGNTSFINSTIQVFRHLDFFSNEIISYDTSEGGNPPFIFFLKSILKDMNDFKEPTKYSQFINYIYSTSTQFKKNETGEVDSFIEYIIQESLTTMIKFQQNNNNNNNSQSKVNGFNQNKQNQSCNEIGQINQQKIDQINELVQNLQIHTIARTKQQRIHQFGQSQETQIDSNENDNFDQFTSNDYCLIDNSQNSMKKSKLIFEETEGKLQYYNYNQIQQQQQQQQQQYGSRMSLEEQKQKAILECLADFKEIDKQIIDIYNRFISSIEYQNILSLCFLFFGVSKVTYFCANCKKYDENLNDINLFKIIKIYDDCEFSLEDRVVQTGFFQYSFCKSCKVETKFIQKLIFYTLPKYLFISIQKQSNYKLQFCSSAIQPFSSSSLNKKSLKSVLDTQQISIETIYSNKVEYSLKGQILNQQGSPKFTSLIHLGNNRDEPIIHMYNDQFLKQRNKFATENVKIVIFERDDK